MIGNEKTEESSSTRTVNIFVGFFFMVNFVLGTGFLGLPFTFFHGGLIAGACTLLVIGVMTWQSALYEVEAMGRAQEIWDFKHQESSTGSDDGSTYEPKYEIKVTRKFEPSELCEVFVGKWLKVGYLIVLTIYSFLACLSYSTVTGSAWSVNIPLNFGSSHQCSASDFLHHIIPEDHECRNAYRFCLMLFAILIVPFSLLDLKEQAIVQFVLGVLRFATLAAIIIYCVAQSFMGGVVDIPTNITIDMDGSGSGAYIFINEAANVTALSDIVTHFNFDGWVVGIPVIVYAYILHQGIPGLTHPIKEKHWLRGYFNTLFITISVLYLVLGIVGSLWFRDIVNETITLNWTPLSRGHHSIPLKILSHYIMIFPSIDVCSVYPLVIHTIVNNVYTVVFGRDTSQDKGWKLVIIQVSMKFVVAFLPIAIALFVSNLVYVLKYAGLAGFFIVLFFPIVLQLSSQWKCFRMFHRLTDGFEASGLQNSTSGDVKSGSEKEYTVQGSKNEKALLLNEQQEKESLSQMVCHFFFSFKAQRVSETPYSTFLSHPLITSVIAFIAIVCFALAITSLSVHPHSQ